MKVKQFNHAVGDKGEDLAAKYLENNGYRIRVQKFRVKDAEIDIIAEKQGVLVFVEVKTRRSFSYGSPAEAVNQKKQRKIIRAANLYIMSQKLSDYPCRFDIIEVLLPQSGDIFINQIENAFEVSGFYW